MTSEFITRVERDKDEPYTVIFSTDDADKYKHIEDECRRMLGHEKPTVDAVPVVKCKECKHHEVFKNGVNGWCNGHGCPTDATYFCADGDRRTDEQQSQRQGL